MPQVRPNCRDGATMRVFAFTVALLSRRHMVRNDRELSEVSCKIRSRVIVD